ncbi:MAG: LysR family transcriptional regulator [Planctomycetes bacterium]|nr:LysR family transcriptional regulator [Planctomycetota bacterium]
MLVIVVHQIPQLSTDQVAAFVELAREGTIRAAATNLYVTEQGLRNRLIALERQLDVELYRKVRGIRNATPLTTQGQQFLPHAIAFLDQAAELSSVFSADGRSQEVSIVASQYLATYVLIRGMGQFHRAHPDVRVRISVRTEHEVETMMIEQPEIQIGFAAPYESSPALNYEHLFSMSWSVVTPNKHRLAKKKQVRLQDLVDEPLIVYESGSTGRQHVIEAFARQSIRPRIEMEATTTDLLVRMVEANLGIAVVPLLPDGSVTRGRKVAVKPLGKQIRAIDSDILTRKNENLSPGATAFIRFIRENNFASN